MKAQFKLKFFPTWHVEIRYVKYEVVAVNAVKFFTITFSFII